VAHHVLIHTDRRDVVEPVRVIDQHPLPLGQDRVVRGVPRHRESFGDPGHGQVLTHQGLQRPPHPAPRDLLPRRGRLGRVLPPHVSAPVTPVAAHPDLQDRGTPPERFMGQPPGHRVPRDSLAPAAVAPLVRLHDPARQHRPRGFDSLPDDLESEVVQPAEGGQVGANEGSVGHVEVFRMGGVGTPIIGRPRPTPAQRRAGITAKSREPPLHPQL